MINAMKWFIVVNVSNSDKIPFFLTFDDTETDYVLLSKPGILVNFGSVIFEMGHGDNRLKLTYQTQISCFDLSTNS